MVCLGLYIPIDFILLAGKGTKKQEYPLKINRHDCSTSLEVLDTMEIILNSKEETKTLTPNADVSFTI